MEQAHSPKYRAFISYSHQDAPIGRRLHRRLEAYGLPKRLVGGPGRHGPVPPRLRPIFRDREELPASRDLSAEIRSALFESGCLIVVCSPAAARSRWVALEIDTFRALHPGRPILAALVMGEPDFAIPAALRAAGVEPLAADFRAHADGDRRAFLRLVAGLVGLGLDDLVRRELQDRVARLGLAGAAAAAAMLAVGASTAVALNARTEAAIREESARQLRLFDLHGRLKDAGRPELFQSVGRPLLQEFASQNLRLLPRYMLAERADILTTLGREDIARGDIEAAAAKLTESDRTTAILIAADSDNPDSMLLRAESARAISMVEARSGMRLDAREHLLEARNLIQRLIVERPNVPGYAMMLSNTEWRLCQLSRGAPGQVGNHCLAALEIAEPLGRKWPENLELKTYLEHIRKTLADMRQSSATTGPRASPPDQSRRSRLQAAVSASSRVE